jgi:hypothetical protein
MSRFFEIYFCTSDNILIGSKQTTTLGKDQHRTGHEGPEEE